MGQLTKDEVFALAVQRYSDTVFRAAMHNCSCTADAEDVVQDVFEKLLRYEGRFESEEHLKAWLLRVAVSLYSQRKNFVFGQLSHKSLSLLCGPGIRK